MRPHRVSVAHMRANVDRATGSLVVIQHSSPDCASLRRESLASLRGERTVVGASTIRLAA